MEKEIREILHNFRASTNKSFGMTEDQAVKEITAILTKRSVGVDEIIEKIVDLQIKGKDLRVRAYDIATAILKDHVVLKKGEKE